MIADLAASFTTSESLTSPVIEFIVSFFFYSSSFFIYFYFSITSDIVLVKLFTFFNAFFEILRFNLFYILSMIFLVSYFSGDSLSSFLLFYLFFELSKVPKQTIPQDI